MTVRVRIAMQQYGGDGRFWLLVSGSLTSSLLLNFPVFCNGADRAVSATGR
jgi:hypothetical protein